MAAAPVELGIRAEHVETGHGAGPRRRRRRAPRRPHADLFEAARRLAPSSTRTRATARSAWAIPSRSPSASSSSISSTPPARPTSRPRWTEAASDRRRRRARRDEAARGACAAGRRGGRRSLLNALFVLPYFVIFLVLLVVPLGVGIWLIFQDYDMLGGYGGPSGSPISPTCFGRHDLPQRGAATPFVFRAAHHAGLRRARPVPRAGAERHATAAARCCARSSSARRCCRSPSSR